MQAWSSSIQGSASHNINHKLNLTRKLLGVWNRTTLGNINTNIKNLYSQLDILHLNVGQADNSSEILKVEKEIDKWEEIKKDFWMQKNK